ncbi:MAG: NHL repeat-containing protein [Candidatus Krumholzibacteria bacterium]|nr:NHL repeat-containing protein [Candidatus Krumholzibacteria bacterium]
MKVGELIPLFVIALVLIPLTSLGEAGTTFAIPPWNHCLGLHKVTQFHLNIFSGYSEKFDDPQGLFCTKIICKDDTTTEKDDDELTVFGLNTGRNRIIYNKSLTSIGIVGGQGEELLKFNRPFSITGDRQGNIFIADTGNNRLMHLRYEDDELIAVKDIKGTEEEPLERPSGVCLSGGLLYTADKGNDRIVVFETDGSIVDRFTPEINGLKLHRPYSIAVISEGDEWFYYRDNFLAVVDSLGKRLWKISTEGEALGLVRYTPLGESGGFNHVAIDYYGNIYVTDKVKGVIHKFDRHLNYIVAIGERNGGGHQFDEPRGITIYRRFGQIFVSERAGARYYWIGTDLLRLTLKRLVFDTDSKRCSIDVSFLITEHSLVSLHLEDEKGKKRFTILADYILPGGKFNRRINVKCSNAEQLAKCKLRLVAIAKPTYASKAFLKVIRKSRLIEPIISSADISVSR